MLQTLRMALIHCPLWLAALFASAPWAAPTLNRQSLELVVQSEHTREEVLRHIAASDDGRWLVSASDRHVCIWDLRSGNMLRTWGAAKTITSVAISPGNGNNVALADESLLAIYDSRSGKLRWSTSGSRSSPRSLFTPDGQFLLWDGESSSSDSIAVLKVADGSLVRRIETGGHRLRAISPEGRWMATTRAQAGVDAVEIALWNLANGRRMALWADARGDFAAFAAGGKELVFGRGKGTLAVASIASGQVERTLDLTTVPGLKWVAPRRSDGTEYGITKIDASADAKQLAVYLNSGNAVVALIDVASGAARQSIVHEVSSHANIKLLRDGWLALPTERSIALWRPNYESVDYGRFRHPVARVSRLQTTADGIWRMSAEAEVHKLMDAATGTERRNLSRGARPAALGGVADPGGRWWAWRASGETEGIDSATIPPLKVRWPRSGGFLALSPDARILAASDNSGLTLLHTASRKEQRIPVNWYLDPLAFSQDGRWLAGIHGVGRLWKRTDAEGAFVPVTAGLPASELKGIAFSADSTRLALSENRGALDILDLGSGKVIQSLGWTSGVDSSLSPDGEFLVTRSSGAERLRVVRLRDGQTVQRYVLPAGVESTASNGCRRPRWIDRGSKIMDCVAGRTFVWNVETGRLLRDVKLTEAVYADRPGLLAAVRAEGGRRQIGMAPLDGDKPLSELETPADASPTDEIAFSADGRLLVFAGRQAYLRDLSGAAEWRPLAGNVGRIENPVFSEDGRWLAGVAGSAVLVWDLKSGTPPRRQEIPPGTASAERVIRFSPDSKLLAVAGGKELTVLKTANLERIGPRIGAPTTVVFDNFSDFTFIGAGSVRVLYANDVFDVDPASGVLRRLAGLGASRALSFSQDGTRLVLGRSDQAELVTWDLPSGRVLSTSGILGSDPVVSVAVAASGKVALAAAGYSTYIVNLENGELLATLIDFPDTGDWLVVSPDGLFDGSPAVWNRALWRFGGDTFNVAPLETYFREFYEPGLLEAALAGQRLPAPRELAAVDRRLPSVTITATPAADEAKLRLEIANGGAGARDLRLMRNGVMVRKWAGDLLRGKASAVLEASVPLLPGNNRFSAHAFNAADLKSPEATTVVRNSSSGKAPGTLHIVTVGINRYARHELNLDFAVSDAKLLAASLQRHQTAAQSYAAIRLVELYDEQATREGIIDALRSLGDQRAGESKLRVGPNDSVVVFYAGHGVAAGGRFFLVPHDFSGLGTGGATAQALEKSAVSDRVLEQLFEGIDARRLLLIVDACQSGQILESSERRRGPLNARGFGQLAYEKGMYVLTATQSHQAATEAQRFGHGLLTYGLVTEGLDEGAADSAPKDGVIELREWLDFSVRRTPELQLILMKEAETVGRKLAFRYGDDGGKKVDEKAVQTPRVYYRRELEEDRWIMRAKAQ